MEIRAFGRRLEITLVRDKGLIVTFPVKLTLRELANGDCEEEAKIKAVAAVRAYRAWYKL